MSERKMPPPLSSPEVGEEERVNSPKWRTERNCHSIGRDRYSPPSPLMGEGRGEGERVKERCLHLYPPPRWGGRKKLIPRDGNHIISLSLDGRGQG